MVKENIALINPITSATLIQNPASFSIRKVLKKVENLEGKHIMITSGPMRGYIDAVRYISNRSTGRLGTLIAYEFLRRNAYVTFIRGAGSIAPDTTVLDKDCAKRLNLIEVETIDDLLATVQEKLKAKPFDVIVHSMAVLDYIPEKLDDGKIASNRDKLTITFTRTPKIIKLIRTLWPQAFFISFKLEVGLSRDELIERAYTSLEENGADLVVANNQNEILGDEHRAYFINSQKQVESRCETKQDISKHLADIVSRHLRYGASIQRLL